MKQFFTILSLILVLTAKAQDYKTIKVDGTDRYYLEYVPNNLGENRPLILALHGNGGHGSYHKSVMKVESVADTAKFVTVFPNGIDRTWDIGGDKDLHFMQALIDEMHEKYNIDRNRVYITGWSMGGMFTYYAMMKAANTFAAFAPMSGYHFWGGSATSARPVPILHIHGTADDCVYTSFSGQSSLQAELNKWINRNHCSTTKKTTKNYRGAQGVNLYEWNNGDEGVEVHYLEIGGLKHAIYNGSFKSIEEIWNFCKRYHLNNVYPEEVPSAKVTIEGSGSLTETVANATDHFVEIPQAQEDDAANKSTFTTEEGVTTYSASGTYCVIFKMLDVNVANCDYITFKFAEPAPSGLLYSMWAKNGYATKTLPAGSTEFKYVFADDTGCAIANDVIPQITLVTGNKVGDKTVKVEGVYKHLTQNGSNTFSFDKALDFTDMKDLEAYVVTAFNPASATLTLSKVTQVPANTGVYLVGKDGTYKVPVIESAPSITTNLLVPSGDGAITTTSGTSTNFVLTGTGASRGFYALETNGNVGQNKAYLQLPTEQADLLAGGTRLAVATEDDLVSSITEYNKVGGQNVIASKAYNLLGQLVNPATAHGLIVLNGKKVYK